MQTDHELVFRTIKIHRHHNNSVWHKAQDRVSARMEKLVHSCSSPAPPDTADFGYPALSATSSTTRSELSIALSMP